MAFHFLVTLLVIQVLVPWPAKSQDCSVPNDAMINTKLRSLLISDGGEGSNLSTTLFDHHFTCLAVGSSRDLYRQVSVAVRYTKNTASGQFTAQFTLRCTSGNFGTVGELDQSPPANVFNISTRRDCFICTTVNSQPGFTIDVVADCALCGSSCLMMGQGGCVTSSTDCCPFYNTDDACTTSCDTNFAATPSTNYTCVVNECAPNPCQNNGTCSNTSPGFECMCVVGYTGTTCEVCATGYMMESGQCVQDCNSSCIRSNTFDSDLCQFVCLITSWYQQAKECGVSLPNINITDAIDTNLPEEEQWDSANSLWTQLRDAWVVEADRRGVNLPTSTPILDSSGSQPQLDQWESSLEQWNVDYLTWQTKATQLNSGFSQQDIASLNFNFTGTTPAQQSGVYSVAARRWTTASNDYNSNLADQCPV